MIWVTGAMKKTLDEDNKSTETYAFFVFLLSAHMAIVLMCKVWELTTNPDSWLQTAPWELVSPPRL